MYYQNPMNDFYLRQTQQFNFPPQPNPQIKTALVTSIEEAKVAMIDPIATNLFLDTSNGKIYLKSISNDGRPQFLSYSIDEQQKQNDPLTEINERLSNIEKQLGGVKNESISSDADGRQSAGISESTVAEPYEPNGSAKSTGFPKNAGNDKWKK